MKIWDEFQIEDGKTVNLAIASLSIWIEHRGEEYLFAWTYGDENVNALSAANLRDSSQVPKDLAWSRYVVQDASTIFQLVPALPDRAVVVSPEFPIKLAPNSNVLFFMSIPMWVQIQSGSKKKVQFLEIPSQVMSNTWFGDTMTGELCYALKTRALRNVEEHGIQPHRILCPVHILNRGYEPLDFQSLCVHVEHLKVFSGEHLWSNEVTISYKGDEQPSEIRYLDRVPKYDKNCILLSPERESSQQKIISRSFSLIKSIATFD